MERLTAENNERNLLIEEKRDEIQSNRDLFSHEVRGDEMTRLVETNKLGMELRLLETAVTQLRCSGETKNL